MPSYLSYMRQMTVMDANDDNIESWITVRGNHIPIMKGQSKEDAVKSFLEKKGGSGEKKPESKPKTESNILSRIPQSYKADTKNFTNENHKESIKFYMEKLQDAYKNYKKDPRNKNYEKEYLDAQAYKIYHENALKPESKYDPEFETVRKNALANSSLYGGRYTQKSKSDAYKAYKADTEKKAYNDKGLYQDALNELDDQIAEKEKELENIHLSMTENAEAGYFDIASANMEDIEFVRGQLKELKKKREKLAGSSGKKAPNGQTIGQLKEIGKDISKLQQAMQHINYGFYEEQGKNMTPEQLVDYLQGEIDKSYGKKDYYSSRVQTRYPEAIKLVKEYIND